MSHLKDDNVHISDDDSNDGIDECQRDLTKNLDGGILKQIVQGGKYLGKPFLDDEVLIHVVGTLKKENKIFFNTRKLEKPWKTKLHNSIAGDADGSDLPKALDIALRTMKKHEIAILTCKSEYCYGKVAYKGENFLCEVPANSDVVFEVELLDFRFHDLSKNKDGGVLFLRRFKKGTGDFYPTYNSVICCNLSSYDDYKGRQTEFCSSAAFNDRTEFGIMGLFNNKDDELYEDDYYMNEQLCKEIDNGYKKMAKVYTRKCGNREVTNELTLKRDPSFKFIDKKNFTWTLGEGELEQIPKGVEIAIENMVVGEKAMFMIRYDYLKEMLTDREYQEYKKNSEFYIFIITLKSCTKAKEYFEMNGAERFEESLKCKLEGNSYLTERKNVKLALKRFRRAIDLLETSIDLDGENSERDELLCTCYLNLCKAYFDAKTPDLCHEFLEKALKMRPTNEKAMYRNGLLLMERKMYAEAKNQFQKLLAHHPSNKAAINMINVCESKLLEQSAVERNLYRMMSKALVN